ncbi:MAG: hypothetical protein QGH74_03555 [Candidatus Brocadiia bacterium]|jgi:hypothetical protein|nr:hypothetical protein [Candidatus Brocadiia bacterium]
MKKLKPLNILDNKGFWPDKAAVADAIKQVLALGGCSVPLRVQDWGRYRGPQWRDKNNNLVPWQSVDWYVYDALDEERMQVDSNRVLHDLANEPWRDDKLLGEHYDLLMLEEDMYDSSAGKDPSGVPYVVGRSRHLSAAVISTHRIEHIWGAPYSNVKTEVMRQLCFMFGVPRGDREDTIDGPNGKVYCSNICILRRAVLAPEDWEGLTSARLKHGALCQSCRRDLTEFFLMAAQESK